jgi:hypothetical protein
MGAYGNIESAMAGLIAEGIESKRSIKTGVCQASAGINFGAGVWAYIGDDSNEVYPIILDTAKVVFAGDFGGTDAVTFTVNGLTTPTVAYASSHSNTIDLIAAAITALTGVEAYIAATAEDATKRTIYIRTKGATAVVSMADIADTPPAETITYETDQVFLGIAAYTAKNLTTANTALYAQYEDVNILEYGTIWALSTGTIAGLQALYVSVTSGATLGRQTATAGKTVNTIAKSDNTTVQTSTTITKIEVKGQYKPYSEKTWA